MRYYLTNLKPGVKRFAEAVRGHWTIENSLHWVLDVTFGEDQSRSRNRRLAENLDHHFSTVNYPPAESGEVVPNIAAEPEETSATGPGSTSPPAWRAGHPCWSS